LSQPYVFVHRPVRSSGPNSVIADDCLGAGLAMRHLVAMGHRRIAHISGPVDWDAAQRRIRGYEDGMMDLGLPIDADLIVPGDWEMQTGYAAGQRLAALDDPPSAIFAANDLMAVGAIYALQDAGLGVPDDVAVVGYDDREICGVTRPSVTSVRMPTHEMGYAAADLLLRMCDGAQGVEHPVRVAGQLVIRDSCGARQGSPGFEPERGSIARALLLSRATQIDQLSRGGNRNARFHEAEHT